MSTRSNGLLLLVVLAGTAAAEPPDTAYLFPAGGQRGTKVPVRIGGYYLYERTPLEMIGPGITGPAEIERVPTKWFEGPVIKQPASQQKEDYPKDYAAELVITSDAALGPHGWRSWNAQGATPVRPFIVGTLPEVVEEETDGDPLPVAVTLPVTINGRIFPREDLDEWTFTAEAGKPITVAVMAEQIGSSLEPRIEIRSATGALVAESTGQLNRDPQLRFTPATSGQYAVRITDTRSAGLQTFVYRMTITAGPWIDSIYPLGGQRGVATKFAVRGQGVETLEETLPAATGTVSHYFTHQGNSLNAVKLDIDELAEIREQEPNNSLEQAAELKLAMIANGRIDQAGDVDAWKVTLAKGETAQLEVRAARLGSSLDAVIVIHDETGKELALGEDLPNGSPDCEVKFTAAKEGTYAVLVQERFASRGGPDFAYRLRCTKPTPDFALDMTVDSLPVDIGSTKKLPINITRLGGFAGAITLTAENLPTGVTAPAVEVKANQNKGELVFTCESMVPVSRTAIRIVGKADIDGSSVTRLVKSVAPPNNNNQISALGLVDVDHLLLVTSLATPFKFAGQYDLQYIVRGSTLRKGFEIDRGGFEGPIWAELSDKQGRHLQGVAAERKTVPPGSSDFEFEVSLPPWMELGRTSRTQLMVVGELADVTGKKHKVSYTTNNQNEQLIAIVSPGPLRVSAEATTMSIRKGTELVIPLQINCDRTVGKPLKIELLIPEHMRDLATTAIEAKPQDTTAKIKLRCGEAPGPLNMPLTIRATSERDGKPIISETPLTLLLQP
ncbi:hypothetical protein [Anatilimnocola floriformis]|uniref:hypothetical protein n=1 Tax=Anatilimnocola floriformis TaxID=2948575 RepID=UPI0020C1C59B|nr:hypothetical protein [Anatilimnocola floriformis]